MDKTPHITDSSFLIERNCSDWKLWDYYVQSHPSSSNYHRYGWRDVVQNTFDHPCFYLAAKDAEGAIAGILPLVFMKSRLFGRFLVSLPFFNYGGVLCDRQKIGEVLLAEAMNLQNELSAEYTELRHTDQMTGSMPSKQHKVAMLLDLAKDAKAQWQGFNAKLRNQIRKAEKSGLSATTGGKELLADFYTVFVRNMRDLGTPVYAQKFFAEVLKAFPDHSRNAALHCRNICL